MKLEVHRWLPKKITNNPTECLVLFVSIVPDENVQTSQYPELSEAVDFYLKVGDLHHESKYLLCIKPPFLNVERLLLVNTNINNKRITLNKLASHFYEAVKPLKLESCDLVIAAPEINQQHFCDALLHASYQFNAYKNQPLAALPKLVNLLTHQEQSTPDLEYSEALHLGTSVTRDLANMPANLCTPDYLALRAQQLADQHQTISTHILQEDALVELGMNAYVAVGRGSKEPTSMPVMHYTGADCAVPPICIIGKGVTFDSGGISLKKPAGMQNMIYDMCGAATVLGLFASLAKLNLPINVIGIVATAENMPDGDAFRPGDILTTMSKQTVEIISTDAEGRLLLCDAITYAQQFDPACIIDIATLTGAHIVSLGSHANGLMGNSTTLNSALQQAGESCGDRAWEMPLWNEYHSTLDSEHADMRNAGNNSPGMITAGCYLSKFAQQTPWAHFDVAGTAFQYGKANSATGRPLPLLLKFLLNCSNKPRTKW